MTSPQIVQVISRVLSRRTYIEMYENKTTKTNDMDKNFISLQQETHND